MKELDWVDLPNDDYTSMLGYKSDMSVAINKLIHEYNRLEKTREENLSQRVVKLNGVVRFIEEWIKNGLTGIEKVKQLNWIKDIAIKKSNYLLELEKIFTNKLHFQDNLHKYHTEISDLYDVSKKHLILNNEHFFSLKQLEYWGNFWVESLDPCHRQSVHYYKLWLKEASKNPTIPHFLLWLEDQELPKYIPQARYFDPKTLQTRKIVIKEGLLCKESEGVFQPAHYYDHNKRPLFVINLKGELYIDFDTEMIFHTSLGLGKPVLAAGLIFINEGKITSISLESGHYIPSIEIGFQIFQILREQGYKQNEPIDFTFFYDRNKYTLKLTNDALEDELEFHKVTNNKLQGVFCN